MCVIYAVRAPLRYLKCVVLYHWWRWARHDLRQMRPSDEDLALIALRLRELEAELHTFTRPPRSC